MSDMQRAQAADKLQIRGALDAVTAERGRRGASAPGDTVQGAAFGGAKIEF